MSKYDKQEAERRKEILIDALGGCCIECLTEGRLQFDHVIPEDMLFRIGNNIFANDIKLLDELQKCQLLCFDCHWKKTRTEQKDRRKNIHGTAGMYTNYKCRCDECRLAWSAKMREYMSKRRKGLL